MVCRLHHRPGRRRHHLFRRTPLAPARDSLHESPHVLLRPPNAEPLLPLRTPDPAGARRQYRALPSYLFRRPPLARERDSLHKSPHGLLRPPNAEPLLPPRTAAPAGARWKYRVEVTGLERRRLLARTGWRDPGD